MLGAIADNRGGELLAAVQRVVEGEGQAAILDVLLHIVNIVYAENAGEIPHQPGEQRFILVGKQLLLSAGDILLGGLHFCIPADHRVALCFIGFGEPLNVFRHVLAVVLRLFAEAGDGLALFLGDFAFGGELKQILGVGHIVDVAVLLPFAVHVCFLLIIAQLLVGGIHGKNQLSVQCGVNQQHHDADNDHHRDQTVQNTLHQILCHTLIPQ